MDKQLIATITIPQYIRRVKVAEARRATYYKQGEKIPLKYQKGEHRWLFIKERKGIVLVDSGGDPVIKNARVAGTPRYKIIKGNDLHALTMQDYERSRIIKALKKQMIEHTQHLEPIPAINFPIRLLCEVYHPIVDPYVKGQDWDVDNHALFYMKVFPDVLCGCPYQHEDKETGVKSIQYQSKRIIPDDNVKFITQPPTPLFYPIENHDDRKLVFKIYSDHREIVKQVYHGQRESN